MVDLVVSASNANDIHTAYNNEVWTSLLVPFICGVGKLLVLGYLNVSRDTARRVFMTDVFSIQGVSKDA